MGADFICSIVFINKKRPTGWERIVRRYKLSKGDVEQYVYNHMPEGTNPTIDLRVAVMDHMVSSLKEFFQIIDDDRRDTAVFCFGKRRMAITGGMSFGDDPTDSFSVLSRVVAMPEGLLSKIGLGTQI